MSGSEKREQLPGQMRETDVIVSISQNNSKNKINSISSSSALPSTVSCRKMSQNSIPLTSSPNATSISYQSIDSDGSPSNGIGLTIQSIKTSPNYLNDIGVAASSSISSSSATDRSRYQSQSPPSDIVLGGITEIEVTPRATKLITTDSDENRRKEITEICK